MYCRTGQQILVGIYYIILTKFGDWSVNYEKEYLEVKGQGFSRPPQDLESQDLADLD